MVFVNVNSQEKKDLLEVKSTEAQVQAIAKAKIYKYRNDLYINYSSGSVIAKKVETVKDSYRVKIDRDWKRIEKEIIRYNYNYAKFLIEKEYMLKNYSRKMTLLKDSDLGKKGKNIDEYWKRSEWRGEN